MLKKTYSEFCSILSDAGLPQPIAEEISEHLGLKLFSIPIFRSTHKIEGSKHFLFLEGVFKNPRDHYLGWIPQERVKDETFQNIIVFAQEYEKYVSASRTEGILFHYDDFLFLGRDDHSRSSGREIRCRGEDWNFLLLISSMSDRNMARFRLDDDVYSEKCEGFDPLRLKKMLSRIEIRLCDPEYVRFKFDGESPEIYFEIVLCREITPETTLTRAHAEHIVRNSVLWQFFN